MQRKNIFSDHHAVGVSDDDDNNKKIRCSTRVKQRVAFGMTCFLLLCAYFVFITSPPKQTQTKVIFKQLPEDYKRQIPAQTWSPIQGECLKEMQRLNRLQETGELVLPTTSIIFTFCNEPQISLYHSIYSVIERSPFHLLHEIILVDDGSDAAHLSGELEAWVKTLPVTVSIIRQGKRTGLMAARVAGANVASGKTLTFLDSHIEPVEGWLTFLLQRVGDSPGGWTEKGHMTRIVFPEILSMSKEFIMETGGISGVGWNARLQDHGWPLQKIFDHKDRQAIDPEASPAMAGGLFTIDREWFFAMGAFDDKMEYWGGENIEISFRSWMCGGSVEFHPCSKVGHVFGGMGGKCTWPGDAARAINVNKWRAARTWMGPYADVIKAFVDEPDNIGNLSNMQAIKDRLKCHDFNWFLENVYPECWIRSITKPFKQQKQGFLKNKKSGKCLGLQGPPTQYSAVTMVDCGSVDQVKDLHIPANWWFSTNNSELLSSDPDLCLADGNSINVEYSYRFPGQVGWELHYWSPHDTYCTITKKGLCLQAGPKLELVTCDKSSDDQKWEVVADPEKLPFHRFEVLHDNKKLN